jgi:integral membrane protein
MSLLSRPVRLYRLVARAEAVTWALLLTGMFLKYVTRTTELGVQVFGMVHGVVFIAYCLTTVLLRVDQRWSLGRLVLGLLAAVPPFATVPFERYAERAGLLGDTWRLRTEDPRGPLERLAAWLLRRPAQGLLVGLLAVAGLTGVALVAGPPA